MKESDLYQALKDTMLCLDGVKAMYPYAWKGITSPALEGVLRKNRTILEREAIKCQDH